MSKLHSVGDDFLFCFGLDQLVIWSSTQEGRIVLGWPMRLGETLLPWKSKDKKCCLYKMPYVAAPIWVLGDIIAKFSALHSTNFGGTYKNQKYSWFMSDEFIKRPVLSYQDSYVHSLQGGLQAKVVPERTTYHVTWGVPRRVPLSVSSSILCSVASSWEKASETLKIKMTARKGCWAFSPNSRASHPLHF